MNKTIHELEEITQAEATDELIVFDVSDAKSKKVQMKNLVGSYSESETFTGQYWIDGKPIYRKVVDCGNLPNNTTKQVAHNISNLGNFVSIRGIAWGSGITDIIPLPLVSSAGKQYDVGIYCTATNVCLESVFDRSALNNSYAILEYTKSS